MFVHLFKYLATFGSASPACTKGTTLEKENDSFNIFIFLAPNAQRTATCGSTNLHTLTHYRFLPQEELVVAK